MSDWINVHHLNARIVYYRVPDMTGAARRGAYVQPPSSTALSGKLEVRDTPFAPWLERELASRAGYECVETMADFRRAPRAVTKAGQIKSAGGRHEKDDRSRIDDRSTYVLGWSNERKISALVRRAERLQSRLNAINAEQAKHEKARDAAIERGQVLAGLDQTREFTEIDWPSLVNRIEELKEEKHSLEAASTELKRLNRDLEAVKLQIENADGKHGAVRERIGGVGGQIRAAGDSLDELRKTLAEPGCEQARDHFLAIGELLAKPPLAELPPRSPGDCDNAETTASGEITAVIDRRAARKTTLSNRIVAAMGEFRRNESLVDVDYNPGRFIRLEAQLTPNTEIRDFRAELRACTDDAVSGDASDQYSEQKFLQVSRIIERFRGREGQTDADRKWTRYVTDVRNWFLFTASERWRADDTEYEHYADSAGKSGGQKEKLAYTILAASLAYQFKLEWGSTKSRTFRFAVIDEAFGRGSDESTRFALELFRRLGLQLLIVTPLQKIHVIEAYVSAVGFVDNPSSRYSRLQTLTIEEYRARRLARAIGQKVAANGPAPATVPAAGT